MTATVIGIGAINVVDRTFNALKCEFEFDAELSAIVAIEDMSKQAGWISTSPPHRERLRINRSFTATIEADRAIEKAGFSFQHIQIEREEIILSKSEVPGTEQLSGGVFD